MTELQPVRELVDLFHSVVEPEARPRRRGHAERLHQRLGVTTPLGRLDISFYRDDFSRIGVNPQVRPSELPFDVENRHLILIDDVLYTGRTIRAALDALMDIGRPASVNCLVVVDRGLQELPIKADIVGRVVPTIPGEEVRVRLSETDDVEGVWLVERVGQASNR